MIQENSEMVKKVPTANKKNEAAKSTPENDPTWQVLANCQVTLPLAGLLKLVPRFTEMVTTILTNKKSKQVEVNFTNPVKGSTIMDEQSPAIKVIIRGQEVPNSIVDGGSGSKCH